MEDIYELVETYRNDSEKHCCSIEIFSPVIDDKEQKRRMEEIKIIQIFLLFLIERLTNRKNFDIIKETIFLYVLNKKE